MSRLLTATPSPLFRVWETRCFTCERWSNLAGRVTVSFPLCVCVGGGGGGGGEVVCVGIGGGGGGGSVGVYVCVWGGGVSVYG